ncbi:unnamed protein product [Rotaria magnacalcarata]|nr:unnamed protein product [Rotaria magnacalcarata]
MSNEQRDKMKTIFAILNQWFHNLIEVSDIANSSKKNQDVKDHAFVLEERVRNLQLHGIYIVPSGFAKSNWDSFNFKHFLMLERKFNGLYYAATIIESESKESKRLIQIDPISDYQISFRELTTDKISLGLEIENIPSENFDAILFLQLITLRTISGHNSYQQAYLYELILSKLGGQGNVRSEKEFFVNMEEKGFFSLSWTLVKNVFYYLLKKFFGNQEAHSLYIKLIHELQFTLLIRTFDKYKNLASTDKLNYLRSQFLLHEMCNKVAYDTANGHDIRKNIITDYILMVQRAINSNNEKLDEETRNKKLIGQLTFRHNSFENFLPRNLKGLKFIQENITSNCDDSLSGNMVRKQFSFHNLHFENDDINFKIASFSRMLEELTKCYGFNRVIQISHLIEDFVFSIVQRSGFKIDYSGQLSNIELARIIIRITILYYNCSSIIVSEVCPDEDSAYEPTYYTKLVLTMFSLCSMMENLIRNDEIIGPTLKTYMISTELMEDSLKSIISKLALPERKWFDLLKKIEEHFQLFTINANEGSAETCCLFHYSSLQIDMSAEDNTDVFYMLHVLKSHFEDSYNRLEEDFKGITSDNLKKKWHALLFSNNYLPELLIHLRDISYLSQLSLYGFSIKVIKKIRSSLPTDRNIYSRFKCSYRQTPIISELDIKIDSSIDKKRFVDFMLSIKQKQKYQRLITFKYDQKCDSSVTENEIINSQNEKPNNLTRPQYCHLASMQLNDNLKFRFMYVALKNDEINFEMEEKCYLVKQALHKVGVYEEICLLEKEFQNEKFAIALVNKFIEIVLELKEKVTQHKSLGHALDILLYLHDFCSDNVKILIDDCLSELRALLFSHLSGDKLVLNRNVASILSCYYILTFKKIKNIDKKDVLQILKVRILIDENAKLFSFVPSSLYIKTMTTIFELSSNIENTIDNNLNMLDAFVDRSNGLWVKNTNMNFYVKECYYFVPTKGRLFRNGHPVTCLPGQILNTSCYKECFGTKRFLVEVDDRNALGQRLLCYKSRNQQSAVIRISVLANDKIWIEENNRTFVSKTYLDKLPKCLLENSIYYEYERIVFYTHWQENNKIFIENEKKVVKFEIDLNSNEIYSIEHKMYLIPLMNGEFYKSNVLYTIFSQFEDVNYILALKRKQQDSDPAMIYLPRLGFKFKCEGTRIISEDFKDYCLSQYQHINTMLGLSQYLVLEPIVTSNSLIKFNRKIIIPYRPIKDKDTFFSNVIQLDLDKIGNPSYFAYEVDENLKCVNSETTAGSFYLALLYFKTATLDKDLFLEMNGYEACAEILKTCWQNSQYSDTEFNIILKFFENKCPDLEKPWSNYAGKEDEMFKFATHGKNPHHRNTHAIFLRLIYLLLSSYQTDFLIETDIHKKTLYDYFLEKGFVNYHFNFYLISKDRIDKRCRLSLAEERKLLAACVNNYYDCRLSDYYKCISINKELQLVSILPKDYKHFENDFLSTTAMKQCNYEEEVMNGLLKNDFRFRENKICIIPNLFSDWVDMKFELSYFISIYRTALEIEHTDDITKKQFSQFLAYLLFTVSNDHQVFIKMLYIVSLVPKAFRPLPKFLLLRTNEIDFSQKLSLNSYSMKVYETDMPDIPNFDYYSNKKTKGLLWSVLKDEYLDEQCQSIFTVNDLLDPEFKVKLGNRFQTVLRERGIADNSNQLWEILHRKLVTTSKNKELHEFFIYIANQCTEVVNSRSIGYTATNTIGLSAIKISLSIEDIEKQFKRNYSYSKINKNDIIELEWTVKSIDIKGHYQNLKNIFYIQSYYPEKIDFPLHPKNFPEGSTVREAFSNGYGKTFVDDLEESYGQQSSIVKINQNYFFCSIGKPLHGIEILKDLRSDYTNELADLENNLNEMKNYLILDVEKWIQSENSHKYVPENEREPMKRMSIVFENTRKRINSALIERKILPEPLALEPLRERLEQLRNNTAIRQEARNWLNELGTMEANIEEYVNNNDILFKLYLHYHRDNGILSPTIFKLICERRKISVTVYKKLDKPVSELEIIEEYSYCSNESQGHLQFIFNNELFFPIEIEEIEDDNISEKFKKNTIVRGYLQTPIDEIRFKDGYSIDNLTDIFTKYYSEYQKTNTEFLTEIHRNISSIKHESEDTNLFVLHRIIGEKTIPTKKEIFCLLKDIGGIQEFNPFIINQKSLLYEKIKCYLAQETLIQQMARGILLISKYNSLHSENDKDERERILENILTNILIERSYEEDVYPSWLLFEIENNLLIRNNQCSLLQTMLDEQNNCIYQLNMGEGKTSVILILFSEMLADSKQIVRINCLESLMGVMQELLKNKFRRLLQKNIYTMPFSRGVQFSKTNLEKIKKMLTECQNGKHILLVTSEHRLCFQLKKQEMFFEYLRSKDADDYFDWNEYNHQRHTCTTNDKTSSCSLADSQRNLKQTLQLLGYIDDKDKILKCPSEDDEELMKFYSELHNHIKDNDVSSIRTVYNILIDNSKLIKRKRKEKLDLLYSIDEFTFFDILDESDEILRHGKELNYTLGSPYPIDGGETRWEIPFLIFKTIFLDNEIGESLKVASRRDDCPIIFQENFRPASGIGGGIPYVRFVNKKYFVENIMPNLRRKICEALRSRFGQRTTNIVDNQGERLGNYEDFIEGKCFVKEDKIIQFLKGKNQNMLNSLLLVKAWLAHELLYHVMSYRHRVEYGLSEKRKKEVAIPFRGKDLPSENSEFSHSDVMIGFTILSYLYRGLDLEQVKNGLIKLKSDPKQDRDNLLEEWIQTSRNWIDERIQQEKDEFPEWSRSFKTLDLQDEHKIKKVYTYLSRNFSFVQYYLSNFIFPNDTKHYKKKLTGNAHTLAGEGKMKGFSGTDDRNDTMPENVIPKRLTSQEGTNGKMLHILSRKINNKYEANIDLSSAKDLLDQVCTYVKKNKDCYILIDTGAMITEMNNLDVGVYLIKHIDDRFEGIVYFSDQNNNLIVILRNRELIPLATCHIDNKKLFVYLDEVHTRGTDLKLPLTARGIVTLGKSINKDKLMQAIMRLRDLDSKQSIVIWGSKEISADIAMINGIKQSDITSRHVLTWVTYNTIQKNEHDLYPVMNEKLKYVIKSRALEYQTKIRDTPIDSLIAVYVSESLNSIEKSYSITPQELNPGDVLNQYINTYFNYFHPRLKSEIREKTRDEQLLKEIDSNLNDIDRPKMKRMLEIIGNKLPRSMLTTTADYNCDQETERETEEMQRIEIAPVIKQAPATEIIWDFNMVFDTNLQEKGLRGEKGYPQLKELRYCFEFIDTKDLKKLKWPEQVFATKNFIKTIENVDRNNKQYQTDYLRPVNMILIHRTDKQLCFILVSAFEAQSLIALCREKDNPIVSLMHIDDVNGPTMIPINSVILTKEEIINVITVIRLFNGESRYSREEIEEIKTSIAFVDKYCFHNDKQISEQIYNELEYKNYLSNGLMTDRLVARLNSPNEQILIRTEIDYRIDVYSRLHAIIGASIADDVDTVSKLPELIMRLIKIRGKSEKYQKSELRDIFNKNLE